MSALPLLGGLTAFTLASGLTLMAVTDAQFQKRALTTETEGTALAVALAASDAGKSLAATTEAQLTDLAQLWFLRLAQSERSTSVRAYSSDGITVAVELCEPFQSWQLPWLNGIATGRSVCARALAREV